MPWGLIPDILIILFVTRYIQKNRKQKQLRCALETICFLLALIIAVPLATSLAGFTYTKLFRDAFADDIKTVVAETALLPDIESSDHMGRIMDEMPSTIVNAAEKYQTLSDENAIAVRRLITSSADDAAQQIVDLVAAPVIQGIFRAVFCLIFFWGLQFLLKALASIVENAMYSPEREEESTVLCGVLGAFKGLIVVSLLVSVIQLVFPALPSIHFLREELFENSFIYKLFYHQNILMLFLGRGIYPTTL